jgi:hypothetical protein
MSEQEHENVNLPSAGLLGGRGIWKRGCVTTATALLLSRLTEERTSVFMCNWYNIYIYIIPKVAQGVARRLCGTCAGDRRLTRWIGACTLTRQRNIKEASYA